MNTRLLLPLLLGLAGGARADAVDSLRAGTIRSRLPLVDMADTSPDFSICSSSRAARL